MPRPPRIYVPGLSLHVFQRGINRAPIFSAEHDCERLLQMIMTAASAHGLDVHGYALMTNHYHLVVTPKAEGVLTRVMREINSRYVRYYNRKYGRIGTLWNERYGAVLLDNERYWFTCLRYVELNPVRAHMVTTPEAYRWSSYRVHAHGEPAGGLVPHHLYVALGPNSEARQAAYRAMCSIPLTEAELTLQRRPPLTVAASENGV